MTPIAAPTSRPTGSHTSCCCRRPGRSSARPKAATSVWLDAERTSPFAFYQYWLNVDDRDAGTYLRWFTLLGREEIEALDAETAAHPEARAAQRALARDVTQRTHGPEAVDSAIRVSEVLFGRAAAVDPALYPALHDASGGVTYDPSLLSAGTATLLADAGVFGSKGEARRLIGSGGLTVNGTRVTEADAPIEAIDGRWIDVAVGKRKRQILKAR